MDRNKKRLKKITVFGLFFRSLGKYPFLSIGATAFSLFALSIYIAVPWYYKKLFDALSSDLPKSQAAETAIKIVVIIAVLNISRLVLRRISEWMVTALQPKFMQDLTLRAFEHMLAQPYRFFSNNFSGSLMRKIHRLSHGIMAIHDTLHYTASTMIVTVVGSLYLIGKSNLTLMWIFAAWIVVTLVFNFIVSGILRKTRLARAAKDTETAGAISDAITNSTNVKLFSADLHEIGIIRKITSELRNLQRRTWNNQNNAIYSQVVLLVIIEFIAIYWSVISWRSGTMTLGDIVLAQTIILKLADMVWNLGSAFRNFYEAYADSQEMIDILNIRPEIKDAKDSESLITENGAISFIGVGFNYNETRAVLKDFSLDIRPGEKVALVGPSGAGKSTVVKLILRFYDVTAGKITIDGQDIAKVTQESLRQAVSLVPQEPILFHRSLMDNIRYGRRGATDKEVYEAAKKAHCHEFISSLPKGYGTFVGERGVKLSGGERQRVAIARAILKDAPILVLDEATSSLDSESESLIHDALHELMADKTVIVIAHRLSTVMEMDRIVVLDGGRIVDQGTHASLLRKRGGIYKKLWEIQAGGFIA
jgi:ATP-binding cassette, subfamily B, bacterial